MLVIRQEVAQVGAFAARQLLLSAKGGTCVGRDATWCIRSYPSNPGQVWPNLARIKSLDIVHGAGKYFVTGRER